MTSLLIYVIIIQSLVIITFINIYKNLDEKLTKEIQYNEKLKQRLEKKNGIKI